MKWYYKSMVVACAALYYYNLFQFDWIEFKNSVLCNDLCIICAYIC